MDSKKRKRIIASVVMISLMANSVLGTAQIYASVIEDSDIGANVTSSIEAVVIEEMNSKDILIENPTTITPTSKGYRMANETFELEIGEYGQITSLYIVGDLYNTNYVMNATNSPGQNTEGHQWMGELMFQTKVGEATSWTESMTQSSSSARQITLNGSSVEISYEGATEARGIKDFKLVETYTLEGDKLRWEIKIINTNDDKLTVGDLGIPLAFNEIWPGNEEIYETRTVDHSFVGKDSSYIYATRPSGLGQFLLLTPDTSTGAGFEYQDHWRTQERRDFEKAWCQDQAGWANGLNVFYIHSDVIKSTNRGYLESTSLVLEPGEEKNYAFNFQVAQSEEDMKKKLYNEGVIDAVAVPGMYFSKDMPAKMYLHTKVDAEDIKMHVKCVHELDLHSGNPNTVANHAPCSKDEDTKIIYLETKIIDNEQYHLYDISFSDLGQNNIIINYDEDKETVLQFYIMDMVENALETHSDFMVEKTQWDAPGTIKDKVFDDWMMDTKSKRGIFNGYWGWGDDWGLTHGQYLAEKNVYQPVSTQIQAVDDYLDVAIWNGLMREHQEDYKIHDFLMLEPNDTPIYRGYAYPHIYNTYFSMYKIASKYPDMIMYKETADTYLMRAYNILNALYQEGVAYNWHTGLMGELTTPSIIEALDREGYYVEAQNVRDIMAKKYSNFKNTKYPYGSEYSYDNTGEEAVYTLAKLNNEIDTANSNSMMEKIDAKTRACRGVQPVWYQYGTPVSICGENWWNFQYTASLAGYCMDDWLRVQDNSMSEEERALSARVNYAGKLANLTCINSGQIDSDPENIGTVSWTYQAEMGNLGGQGTGGGNLHNGWRQMAGEADLGLFGAVQILSSDVAIDPVFGLFGYGCEVEEDNDKYYVTPLDGLYTKLNFITEGLYIALDRDQYTQATVDKDNTRVALNVKNLEGTAHETDIEFTGLKPGSYRISVNGIVTGSFLAIDGKTAVVTAPLPVGREVIVVIEQGEALANTAPTVTAGVDQMTYLSDAFRLVGKVKDDGYPIMEITNNWEVAQKPEGATVSLKNADKLITEVSFDKSGEYIFELTVSDGELSGVDTVTITVVEDLPVPESLAHYTFDNIDEENKQVVDESGEGYNAKLVGNPTLGEAKEGSGISMDGIFGKGYVKLPEKLTQRVEETTIAVDIYLNSTQSNGVRLLEFGDMNNHYFYIGCENENELILGVTDFITGTTRKYKTDIILAPEYWKNIALTLKDNTIIVYIDGINKAKFTDCNFSFDKLGDVQRNYIGRSYLESISYFDGVVDNFIMKSVAMTDEEILEDFGTDEERVIVSAKDTNVVTPIGKAPALPGQVMALYSDGTYEKVNVVWEVVNQDQYAQAGQFNVKGVVDGTEIEVMATVIVVSGTIQNLGLVAAPTAIIDTPSDLGGVKGLNDNYEPSSSRDTSHGVWHNWQGDQGGPAWVQYTWESEVILTGMDAYYFTDGNFAPASVEIQYLNENGVFIPVMNAEGLGVELNQYNYTSFDPIMTTAIRMVMKPKTLGIGVIEWKVYGYSEEEQIDRNALRLAINHAKGLNSTLFLEGWEVMQFVLIEAINISNDKNTTQIEIDEITSKLSRAIVKLVSKEGNLAYSAMASTSFVSSWEKLSAVNDGVVSSKSDGAGISAKYGTWGNQSSYETVDYTWPEAVTLQSAELFIWNDGGGIRTPKSYVYQYKDEAGNWVEVSNANGYGIELDKFNMTTFDAVITKEFRVTIYKSETNNEGIGLIEWKVASSKNEVPDEKDLPTLTIEMNDVVNAEEEVEVVIGVSNGDRPIYAQDFVVQYDTECFELSGYDTIYPTEIVGVDESVAGQYRFLAATDGGILDEASIKLTFKALAVTEDTETRIKVTNVLFGVVDTEAGTASTLENEDVEKAITIHKEVIVVDKLALAETIERAETLSKEAVVGTTPGTYPAEAKAELEEAIEVAKDVMTTSENQIEVNAATAILNKAIDTFKASINKEEGVVIDKSELYAAIKKAEALSKEAVVGTTPGTYPAEAKAKLEQVIGMAKDVAITSEEQIEVDAVIVKLNQAIDTFKASINKEDGVVDKTALAEVIEIAEAISKEAVVGDKPGNYPAEAKVALDKAIKVAKDVAATSKTQNEIDIATLELYRAIDTFKASINRIHDSDVDGNGIVDIADLALATYYYKEKIDSDKWEIAQKADVVKDGEINILDLSYIAGKILIK